MNEIHKAISSFALNSSRRSSHQEEPAKTKRSQYSQSKKVNKSTLNLTYSNANNIKTTKSRVATKKSSLRYSEHPTSSRMPTANSNMSKFPQSQHKYNFDNMSNCSDKKEEKSVMSSKSILEFTPNDKNTERKEIKTSKDSILSTTKSSISCVSNMGTQLHEMQTQIELIKSYIFHVLRPKQSDTKKCSTVEGLLEKLNKMEAYFKTSQKIAGDLAFIYKNTLDDIGELKQGIIGT